MPNSNTPETTETKAIRTVSGALDVLNVKLGGTAGDIPADATKVDALKKVYETLGGTPADVADLSTTYELVEKIAEVAEGGGGGGGGENWNTATPHFTIVLDDENGTFTFGSDAPETPLVAIKNALDNGEIYFVQISRSPDGETIEYPAIAIYAKPSNIPYNAMFAALGSVVEVNGRTGQFTETYPE